MQPSTSSNNSRSDGGSKLETGGLVLYEGFTVLPPTLSSDSRVCYTLQRTELTHPIQRPCLMFSIFKEPYLFESYAIF